MNGEEKPVNHPLFDIGPAVPAAPRWRDVRRQVIASQHGRCANAHCRKTAARLDVVRGADGAYVAYCRPCRLRWDAPARSAKARATRAKGVQLRIPGTNGRALRLVLPPARTLVDEALLELFDADAGERSPGPASPHEGGAWALVRVLRRRGVTFADDQEKQNDAR